LLGILCITLSFILECTMCAVYCILYCILFRGLEGRTSTNKSGAEFLCYLPCVQPNLHTIPEGLVLEPRDEYFSGAKSTPLAIDAEPHMAQDRSKGRAKWVFAKAVLGRDLHRHRDMPRYRGIPRCRGVPRHWGLHGYRGTPRCWGIPRYRDRLLHRSIHPFP
jgi:hypothetical protein